MVPLNSFRLSGDRIIWLLKVVPASMCYVLFGDLNSTSQNQCAYKLMVVV